jgi:hypothetical protein
MVAPPAAESAPLREAEAAVELRQACIDLSAICELIADDLPAPR